MAGYEHPIGKGRAFPNDKATSDKHPHFRGSCNPVGDQKEISLWLTLNDGVDPGVIDKIKSSIKSISVGIQEPYKKDNADGSSKKRSSDEW